MESTLWAGLFGRAIGVAAVDMRRHGGRDHSIHKPYLMRVVEKVDEWFPRRGSPPYLILCRDKATARHRSTYELIKQYSKYVAYPRERIAIAD